MNVRFPEIDEHYIKTKVQKGFYMNETELVRDAVRHMREQEEQALRFKAAVNFGVEQIERGEGKLYSEALMDEIRERAIAKAEKGEPIRNPDPVPEE